MINVDAEEGAYAGYNKAIKKLKNIVLNQIFQSQ
jgi:hypothetical protein